MPKRLTPRVLRQRGVKADATTSAGFFGHMAAAGVPCDVTGYGSYSTTVPYPDTIPGYLITPAGQASYERDLVSLVASLPHGRGLGVFYWDGDSSGVLGMFGRSHAAQPVVDAYQIGTTPTTASP